MPPKKRALVEVDSNAQIEENKGNKKGKMSKEKTGPAPATAAATASAPAAEESGKEEKIDEVCYRRRCSTYVTDVKIYVAPSS